MGHRGGVSFGLGPEMRSPLRRPVLLLAILAALPAAPAAGQQSIADLKLAPQDARGRTLALRGEAVEVRALSPRSLEGFYRLLDGTDPIGVLIRTSNLPTSGGPFTVEARLSPEVLRDGLLLLDETGRRELRAWQWWAALALAGAGLLALGTVVTMFVRAAQDERQRRLAPPLWLIPAEADPEAPAPSGTAPPLARIDLDADDDERDQLEALASRTRRIVRWVAPAVLLATAGGAWAAVVWRTEAGQPAFVLLEPVGAGAFATAPPAVAPAVDSSPMGPPDAPPALAVVPGPTPMADAGRRQPRRDSAASAAATPPPATVLAPASPPVSTAPASPAPPPAAPTQVPEAAPPAVERVTPVPTRPDPATLRRMAEDALEGGIGRFVAAVVGRQPVTAATLYANSDSRRTRFLDFLTQYQPEAAKAGAEAPTVGEASAEAVFRVNFRWRGEFGVARRKEARFIATARRDGDTWTFESIRLLENLP